MMYCSTMSFIYITSRIIFPVYFWMIFGFAVKTLDKSIYSFELWETNEKSNKYIVNNLIPSMLFLLLGNQSQRFSNSIWILTRNVFLIILVSPHIYHVCKWSEIHVLPSPLNGKKHVTIDQFFKLFWSELLCWSIKFPKKELRIKWNPQHSIQYSQHSSSCQKKITVFFFIKALSKSTDFCYKKIPS